MQKNPSIIEVDVCYALAERQTLLQVTLPVGATVQQAIDASDLLTLHPEIDLAKQKVGIFGKLKSLQTALIMHDRVEIYRPLKIEPKLARQQRVAKARGAGSEEGRKWIAKRTYT